MHVSSKSKPSDVQSCFIRVDAKVSYELMI